MKNADKSAYPYKPNLDNIPSGSPGYKRESRKESMGLTKRERFALAALESGMSPTNTHKTDETAEWCVKQADALLKELEETDEH